MLVLLLLAGGGTMNDSRQLRWPRTSEYERREPLHDWADTAVVVAAEDWE